MAALQQKKGAPGKSPSGQANPWKGGRHVETYKKFAVQNWSIATGCARNKGMATIDHVEVARLMKAETGMTFTVRQLQSKADNLRKKSRSNKVPWYVATQQQVEEAGGTWVDPMEESEHAVAKRKRGGRSANDVHMEKNNGETLREKAEAACQEANGVSLYERSKVTCKGSFGVSLGARKEENCQKKNGMSVSARGKVTCRKSFGMTKFQRAKVTCRKSFGMTPSARGGLKARLRRIEQQVETERREAAEIGEWCDFLDTQRQHQISSSSSSSSISSSSSSSSSSTSPIARFGPPPPGDDGRPPAFKKARAKKAKKVQQRAREDSEQQEFCKTLDKWMAARGPVKVTNKKRKPPIGPYRLHR
jgi:hypothetical protein